MTAERLAEIRESMECRESDYNDVAELLAEVDRLAAQRDRLVANTPSALARTMKPQYAQAFERFVRQMRLKLAVNAHKTGWRVGDGCTMSFLWGKLDEERGELRDAINADKDSGEVVYEAADVANIAMMIADHYRDHNAIAAVEKETHGKG